MIQLDNTPAGYALTYFTFSMIVAGIAQGKNRSGFRWWLLSMIITPPIALFILVVLPKDINITWYRPNTNADSTTERESDNSQ